METPFFSVLMTAFNREQYIAEAIESVLVQNYTSFELIICDDCSTDNSFSIIQSYAEKDERIKVHRGEKNIGQFPNRNKAASLAIGHLLVFADSDDSLKPDALHYLSKVYSEHPNADFWLVYYGKAERPLFLESKAAIDKHFFEQGFLHIGPGGTVITKKLFDEIGGFPTKYGPAGDMFYNVKAASNGSVLLLPYIYSNYRRHEGQELNNPFSYLYNTYNYYNDLLRLPEIPLSFEEREFLSLKSKRRFVVNTFMYFVKTGNLYQTLKAFYLARFGFKDFIKGIIH
ncbi:MAG: glycosyltransferase family 2 protein [Chitinophagaceae bacterium]|nr:glycosyltransferase family 2 protein [Chitinophagaceae bacterium]